MDNGGGLHYGQDVEKRFNASVVVGKRVEGRWGRVRDLAMSERGCRGPMPQGDAGVLRAGMRGRNPGNEQVAPKKEKPVRWQMWSCTGLRHFRAGLGSRVAGLPGVERRNPTFVLSLSNK
jgi:hypothetical protein